MKDYTLQEVSRMTYAELGAIEDPMTLMSTGGVSPMLVRYMVRTGQLESRYPGVALPMLLRAITQAAATVDWPLATVAQAAPLAVQDAAVDAYLDNVQPQAHAVLKALH
ncbi:hypothetical protein [Paraburkholderia pallida]|uniref:Uncharacterized protein n=1 Tax=Paraburkholderia pallida TaxID=2547399 RepID=A0A4P7DB59_9BURK|nr:hypothetical protein [Paraburkholderia pallida]QBR04184.1 hypothetical protein E1956_44445 [Paraburkholderia pallida]